MRYRNHPFAENGFMDVCVKLAQTAFFDNLPSNVQNRPHVPCLGVIVKPRHKL